MHQTVTEEEVRLLLELIKHGWALFYVSVEDVNVHVGRDHYIEKDNFMHNEVRSIPVIVEVDVTNEIIARVIEVTKLTFNVVLVPTVLG